MAYKALESVVQGLVGTVASLTTKVSALETLICDQNALIKTQSLAINQLVLQSTSKTSSTTQSAAATAPPQQTTRPTRKKATPTISAAAAVRVGNRTANASPALTSRKTTLSEDGRQTPIATPPTTPSTPITAITNNLDNVPNEKPNNNEKWTTVSRRKRKPSIAAIQGSAQNTTIKGVDVHKHLHGCFFKKSTKPEDVIEHLRGIHAEGQYTAELIASKRDTYASFKIGIPTSIFDKFTTAEAWPVNISISEWLPFLSKPKDTTSTTTEDDTHSQK
ncbi:hypothetical protein JYU34_001829 [Plutella xylostella]|uniref:Uncharacterized protein n=1 Tax=Plutella xylostella TaxID=51655 RepID=A0ABQ7R4V4_PLUXY|nr:hypothetical protein JYU34_001829 [Plutella xylostella]